MLMRACAFNLGNLDLRNSKRQTIYVQCSVSMGVLSQNAYAQNMLLLIVNTMSTYLCNAYVKNALVYRHR